MSSSPENSIPTKRTRKSHAKSRNGCMECKRRRVKCDEQKPSCTRCARLLNECKYIQPREQFKGTSPPSSSMPQPTRTNSTGSPGASDQSLSPHLSLSHLSLGTSKPTDSDLYDHYLSHTSRTLTHIQNDQKSLQFDIVELASRNRSIYHAILAVSAACLCHDLMTKHDPQPEQINDILNLGYEHYNSASELIRAAISQADVAGLEPLLASAGILVPFATGSQQVKHWLSSKKALMLQEGPGQLLSTPRDVIVLMRGIRATREALTGDTQPLDLNGHRNIAPAGSTSPPLSRAVSSSNVLAPSRNHVLYSVISLTSSAAFSSVLERSLSLTDYQATTPDPAAAACRDALDVLMSICKTAFEGPPPQAKPAPEQCASPHYPPWLRSFEGKSTVPGLTEPLTIHLLLFLVHAPQAYLDLVLPLLDQRIEDGPLISTAARARELSHVQALALDIYAHWSILMLLVEDESWWIGDLPTITLSGMINRYGQDFVPDLWPDHSGAVVPWWPGDMLGILRTIRQYT